MAHYAFIDENWLVTEVIVGKDEANFNWEDYYGNLKGKLCKRTSYNTKGGVHTSGGTPLRKNFASVGYTYDPNRDAFIPPKPYPSWQLDEETCLWNPPSFPPTDDQPYFWNEATLSWVQS